MKKTLYLLFALLMSYGAQAQLTKGDIQVGGGLSYSTYDQDDFSGSQFSIVPRAGLFISDNISLGLTIGYSSNSNDQFNQGTGQTEETTNSIFQFGAYARFHKPLGDNIYVYLQPGVGVGSGTTKAPNQEDGDINVFNVNIAPGLAYFISPRFSLDLTFGNLSYSNFNAETNGNEVEREDFSFNMNLSSLGFGLSYYFK